MFQLNKREIEFLINHANLSELIINKLLHGVKLTSNDKDIIYDKLQDLEQEIGFDINYCSTKNGLIIYNIMRKLMNE